MTEPVMLVNSVLNGYRILSKIIECPQTVLYRGVNEANLHEVAVKMLLPHYARERHLVRQLRREARYETKLSHPSIIKGRGFFRKPVRHHFIMDYFPSKSMRFRLMDENDTVVKTYMKKIMVDMAEALAYIHERGLVHRDVKPENILVNSAGDSKLIDLALASRYDFISRIFVRRRVQGTASYMSPEQIRGKALDNRADIYSFGATMFEMVVGHPPFTGASEPEILRRHLSDYIRPVRNFRENVTSSFDALVRRMLAKSPSERPRGIREVADTLKEIDIFIDQPDQPSGGGGQDEQQ